MFNLQICAVVSGGAFFLSSLIGFIGGADFFTILLRAVVFAAVSFGFVAGAQQLITLFLPELLGGTDADAAGDASSAEENQGEQERVGEKVDVSVGDEDDEELPQYVAAAENDEDGFLPASGLDQRTEGGYTGIEQSSKSTAVAARPPELIGDVDVLPDLEGLSDSFVTPISVDNSSTDRVSSHGPSAPSASGDGGKFDAKEMAMAIQTILKRDQKG